MLLVCGWASAQMSSWQPDLTVQQTYTVHRSSSSDPTGGNADYREVAPGATFTILDASGQNQDFWWGEGDDMFFIDGEKAPSIAGTGSEDYFLGSHDFVNPFSHALYGAPVVGA